MWSRKFSTPLYKATKHSVHKHIDYFFKNFCLAPGVMNERDDRSASLVFGPFFGNIFKLRCYPARSNTSMVIGMMSRLLGTKKDPGHSGLYRGMTIDDNERYFVAQSIAIGRHEMSIKHWFTQSGYNRIVDCRLSMEDTLMRSLVPGHPKLKGRISTFKSIRVSPLLLTVKKHHGESVRAKVKMEPMKFQKPCRIYISISGPDLVRSGGDRENLLASMTGAGYVDDVKHMMACHPLIIQDGEFRGIAIFISGPKYQLMSAAFDALATCRYDAVDYDLLMVYFSDDSCVSFRTSSGIRYINADIASCDASHSGHLFSLMRRLLNPTGHFELPDELIDQLTLPVVLEYHRASEDRRKSVVSDTLTFTPKEPVLYSGSVLTTLTNNLACILMFCEAVAQHTLDANSFVKACGDVGYVVTYDVCEQFSDLQFLKHSPVLAVHLTGPYTGEKRWSPVLNLGPLFRTLGSKMDGVLPIVRDPISKSMDMAASCRAFTSGVIHGMYPRVQCDILRSLHGTDHLILPKGSPCDQKYKNAIDDGPLLEVTGEDMLTRYRLPHHAVPFCQAMSSVPQYLRVYNSPCSIESLVAHSVLLKDYSLKYIPDFVCRSAHSTDHLQEEINRRSYFY